ncbi:MAG: putative phosphatidate cytidylyltransferase [Actinomycetota bacterium]
MSDDNWRGGSDANPDDDFEDFGELRFSEEENEGEQAPLSFDDDNTGPLPHWTVKPTSELPRLFPEETTRDVSREVSREVQRDDDGEVDVWGSYSGSAPRPVPDRPADAAPRPASDTSGSRPIVRLGDPSTGANRRGADTTTGAATRPIPSARRDDTSDTSRPGRLTIGGDDGQGRVATGSRPRPVTERGPRPRSEVRPRGRALPATSNSGGRDLPMATAVGILMVAAFIAALLWKPVAILAIVVLVCGLAAVEFFEKVTERGYRPATILGITVAICAPLGAYWVGENALPVIFVLAFIACAATLGMLWIGMMGSFGALLAGVSNVPGLSNVGTDTLFIIVVGVSANDIGALFVGQAAGKTPLRAWISPNKTLEGLMGGTVATLVAMWVVSLQSDTWNSIGEVLLLVIAVSVLAPLGDLVESMFKRNLEVKDFGSLIRGHGGVLDRFDSYLFVLPAAYYLLMVLQPYAS